MGMDILDICFRLEKAFGIKIPKEDLAKGFRAGVAPEPVTAGDIHRYILRRYEQIYGDLGKDRVCTFDRPCPKCGYNLRGLTFGATCPECGEAGVSEGQIWRGVRRVLRKSLGVERWEVGPDSRLVQDLGCG